MTKTEIQPVTAAEFKALVERHKLTSKKMIAACRRVFVHGESRRAASIAEQVDYGSLHRTVRKLQGLCPHCGQPLPEPSDQG